MVSETQIVGVSVLNWTSNATVPLDEQPGWTETKKKLKSFVGTSNWWAFVFGVLLVINRQNRSMKIYSDSCGICKYTFAYGLPILEIYLALCDCLIVRCSPRQMMAGEWIKVSSAWHVEKVMKTPTNWLARTDAVRLPDWDPPDTPRQWLQTKGATISGVCALEIILPHISSTYFAIDLSLLLILFFSF